VDDSHGEPLDARSSFIFALLLVGPVAADEPGPSRDAYVAKDDPLGESVEKVVYLDQGWSPAVSLKFYFTSQGSQIIPYDWFLALEPADSQTLFRDNQNILKYRYLPQLPDSNNPDGLPVGFVGDTGVGRTWLGLTCAACHTNEIRYGTTGYRVDGAPTQGDVRALLSALITTLQKTRDDPAKFERFAAKVLGNQNSSSGQSLLKAQLAAAIDKRIAYNLRNFPGYNIGVRTFDPVRVGYLTDVTGFPKFNVNDSNGNPIIGNSNAGHEGDQYGTNLSPDQRRQLIEYLKSL